MRWRPVQTVRPISIGVAVRAERVLAMRVFDDAGALKGVRPPGGAIEFGETAEAALRREFEEEFGAAPVRVGAPLVVENIFSHEGATGHEIVFAFPITLPDGVGPTLSDPDQTFLTRENEVLVEMEWTPLERLAVGAVALFPEALLAELEGLTRAVEALDA